MDDNARKKRWVPFLAVGLIAAYGGIAIYNARDPKYNPKPASVTHYVAHFSDPKCWLRAKLIIGGHDQAEMEAGDQAQKDIWELAKRCNGRIEIEKTR